MSWYVVAAGSDVLICLYHSKIVRIRMVYSPVEPSRYKRENRMTLKEGEIEQKLINKLEELKYSYRPDIRDKAALEQNFREKFEALNRVSLTDAEFARLRDEIINADVFQAAKTLREYGYMEREDGTPLHYQLVNLKDWCKNEFEVINQLEGVNDSV